MNRRVTVVAAAAGVLVVSAGAAVALAVDDRPTTVAAGVVQPTGTTSATVTTVPSGPASPSPSPSAGLTPDDAGRLVREQLGGGHVAEVEREVEHGRLEWKVEISKDGVTYDIRVDAETGEITRVDVDDRDEGRGDDRGEDRDDGRDGGRDDGEGDDKGGHR